MLSLVNNLGKPLLFSILITSIVIFVRDVFNIGINQYIIFTYMTVVFMFLKKRDCILYLAYTCGIITGINAYILIVGIVAVLLKNQTYIKNNKDFVLFSIIIFFWELFNCYNYYTSPKLSILLLYGGYIFVFFYYLMVNKKEKENKDSILCYCIGLGVAILIINIGVLQNPLDVIFEGEGEIRGAMGYSANRNTTHFTANANHLAYFSIVLISLLLCLKQKFFNSKFLFGGLLIIAFIAGFLSRSRTWLLLCPLLLLVIFFLQKGIAKKIRTIFYVCIIIIIIFYLFSDLLYIVYDGFLNRFEQDNFSTAGSRTEIIKEYNDFMFNHIEYILGGTGAIYYAEIAQCSFSSHNATQQIFVSYGILGCLFFTYVFIKSIKKHDYIINRNNYIPFITAAIFIQTIQFLNPFYLMLPIAFASLVYKIRN